MGEPLENTDYTTGYYAEPTSDADPQQGHITVFSYVGDDKTPVSGATVTITPGNGTTDSFTGVTGDAFALPSGEVQVNGVTHSGELQAECENYSTSGHANPADDCGYTVTVDAPSGYLIKTKDGQLVRTLVLQEVPARTTQLDFELADIRLLFDQVYFTNLGKRIDDSVLPGNNLFARVGMPGSLHDPGTGIFGPRGWTVDWVQMYLPDYEWSADDSPANYSVRCQYGTVGAGNAVSGGDAASVQTGAPSQTDSCDPAIGDTITFTPNEGAQLQLGENNLLGTITYTMADVVNFADHLDLRPGLSFALADGSQTTTIADIPWFGIEVTDTDDGGRLVGGYPYRAAGDRVLELANARIIYSPRMVIRDASGQPFSIEDEAHFISNPAELEAAGATVTFDIYYRVEAKEKYGTYIPVELVKIDDGGGLIIDPEIVQVVAAQMQQAGTVDVSPVIEPIAATPVPAQAAAPQLAHTGVSGVSTLLAAAGVFIAAGGAAVTAGARRRS